MTTILVVDDDPVAQRVLGAQLRKAGYIPAAARSGQEALRNLAQIPCDLAILDIGLPDMDGLSFLRILRADADHKTMPVIVLTASGRDDSYTDAKTAGANGFLRKPASSNELIETVSQLLRDA